MSEPIWRPMLLPPFITPAAPRLRLEPPSGPQWSHEVKFDGWRVQVRRDGRGVALLSRRGLDLTGRFSRVARAVEALPARNFIIDGELVALDAAGLHSFDDLTRRDCDATLCAFDILFDDGRDLRGQPLLERRRRLGKLLGKP